MKRADVVRLLAEHREELTRMGVASLTIFGSVARDEAGPDSDVDLLVELNRPIGLFEFGVLQQRLESILGARVDLGMPDTLKSRMRAHVLQEAVRAI